MPAAGQVRLEVVLQGNGVVVGGILGGVEQSDIPFAGSIQQRLPDGLVVVELGGIFSTEGFPAGRIVGEPLPQRIAGGEIL